MRFLPSIFILLVICIPTPIFAAGTFITNPHSQLAPTESRAIVGYKDGEQIMLVSQSFALNPLVMWNFGWLIPVPSEPTVEIFEADVFIQLDEQLQNQNDKQTYQPAEYYTRAVYMTQYLIFAPHELERILIWAKEMGFVMPKVLQDELPKLLEQGMYIVALEVDGVHLEIDARDSLTVTAAHTMPVLIKYKTDSPAYPLSLTKIQPDLDSESVTLSYQYGSSSESVLGERDDKVDSLLRSQSERKYPALPLDSSAVKIDLVILSPLQDLPGDTFFKLNEVIIEGGKLHTALSGLDNGARFMSFVPSAQLEDIILSVHKERSTEIVWVVVGISVALFLFLRIRKVI